MARELILHITDDFDKSTPADESRVIGWDGYDYFIDLTTENDKELQEALRPYLEVAHHKTKQTKTKKSPSPAVKKSEAVESIKPADKKADGLVRERRAEIRAWAIENGLKVGEKGLLAQKVIEAYKEAHQ